MTKPRAPLTFALAITTIAGRLGWAETARIARRKVRAVRYWSEEDKTATPTLAQAFALDRAFIAAGGDHAPLLDSYARQLDIQLSRTLADRAALAHEIASTSIEAAEAVSSSIHAMQPDASETLIHHAIKEAADAHSAFQRLLARLKSFVPAHSQPTERGQ